MTIPIMPLGLVPGVSAYSGTGPGGVIRTEVAGGAARYRLDWARGRDRFDVRMNLNRELFSIWSAFYHHIIKKGALPFEMRLDSGLGVSPHRVNLVPDSYEAAMVSGEYSVGFAVECDNAAYRLSADEVAAYGLSADAMPAGFVPAVSAYSFGGPGGVMRDDVSGGVAGNGLEWDRGLQQFSCTLVLPPEKFAIWTVWYHRVINKGARTFDMRLDSGSGANVHAATIIPGSYSTSRTGGTATVVSFIVEAESKAYSFTAADAQAMIDLHNMMGGVSTSELLARIARFSTADTNVLEF